jgi:hypothetical protein
MRGFYETSATSAEKNTTGRRGQQEPGDSVWHLAIANVLFSESDARRNSDHTDAM